MIFPETDYRGYKIVLHPVSFDGCAAVIYKDGVEQRGLVVLGFRVKEELSIRDAKKVIDSFLSH